MLRVDRSKVAVPAALHGPTSAAESERIRARQAFGARGSGRLEFRIYKDESVKRALGELFGRKCAYCESAYAATQPMDVEHFRPKGGFIENERLEQPGYWWLASDWENLLPSCIDCNRRRQHGDGVDQKSYGKENLFPVEGNRARAEDADLEAELRLLLDPCRDDPAEFFVYGEGGVIEIKPRLRRRKRLMARTSMEVYGLVRPDLVKARRDRQLSIFNQIESLFEPLRRLKASPVDQCTQAEVARLLRELVRMRSTEVEYTAMARFYIDSKLASIRAFLEREYLAELPAGEGADEDIVARFIEEFAPQASAPSDFDFLNG